MKNQIFNKTYYGIRAIDIFDLARNYPDILALAEEILSISYHIHLGFIGYEFIIKSFEILRDNINDFKEKKEEIFAQRRTEFKNLGLLDKRKKYKEESLLRSIRIAGKENFKGIVVDVGANDNSLGRILLQTCKDVQHVVGVDVERRASLVDTDNVKFIIQQNPSKIPLPNDYANTLIIRFSLHHMKPKTQTCILNETYRVLRRNGRIIIFEDTYSVIKPAVINSDLNIKFLKLNNKFKFNTLLSFLDASSCIAIEENMPFNFCFNSIEEWSKRLTDIGYKEFLVEYWGLPFLSLFQAPFGLIIFEKS